MPVVLYLFFFGFYFFGNYRRYGFNASSFVLLLYLVSVGTAAILLFNFDVYDIEKMTYVAAIYHSLCLYLFISPIVSFANGSQLDFKLPTEKGLQIFAYLILVLCFMSIAHSIAKLEIAFSFADLSEARRLHNKRELFENTGNQGIFDYFASFGHHFSFFAVLLFFLYVVYFPHYKKLIALLFVASLAIVLNNLSIMGRDGIVRWLFFFGFWFFFFKNSLSEKFIRRIIRGTAIISIPLISVFGAITIARFSGRSQDILFYLLDYLGEPVIMFAYNFETFFEGSFWGRLNFPVFFEATERVSMNNLNETIYAAHSLNTFPTFVGNFYMDFGFIGTLLLALGFKIFTLIYFNFSADKYQFSKIIFFAICIQIILLGVFYFMFYSPTVFKSLLLVFILSLFIQIKWGSKKYVFS